MELSFVAGDQLSKIETRNQDIDRDREDLHVQEESSISDGVNKHSAPDIVEGSQNCREEIEAPIAALRQEFAFEAISESSTATPLVPQVLVDGSEAMTVEIYALEDESEPPNSSEMAELSKQLRTAPMSESWRKMVEIGQQLRAILRETVDELREWREEIEAKAEAPTKEPSQEILVDSTLQLESSEDFAKDRLQESFLSPTNLSQEDSSNIEAQVDSEQMAVSFGEIGNEIPSVQEEIETAPIETHKSHKSDKDPKELHILFELPKVISCVSNALDLEATILEVAMVEIMASNEILVNSVETKIAYSLFDEMPKRGINVTGYDSEIFDPGIWESCTELSRAPKSDVHVVVMKGSCSQDCLKNGNLVFDPGIAGFCVTPSKFVGLSLVTKTWLDSTAL